MTIEVEPKVLTEDVQKILRRVVQPGDDSEGDSVALIAELAKTSTRTVYRVLASQPTEDNPLPSINLHLADRLVIAANSHLWECRLVWPGDRVTDYLA